MRNGILVFLVRAFCLFVGEKISLPPSPSHLPFSLFLPFPLSFATNFLYYIPYFLSTRASVTVIQIPIVIYVDINGNPRGCPVASHPASRRLKDAVTSHAPRPRVQILCFIESESCHCYCWLRAASPFPHAPFSLTAGSLRPASLYPAFHGCQPWVREGETSHRRRRARRVPMNFINKTTSTEMCAALTRSDKARTDRPVQPLLYVSPRDRRAWRI